LPDVGWGASARLCAVRGPSSGHCDGGKICTPTVGPPFEHVYCITKADLASCPPGPYAERRVYYGAAADTRGCTACSCSSPSVSCEGGTVSVFDSPGCIGPSDDAWSAPQACTAIGESTSFQYKGDAVLKNGPCAPSGGAPVGGLTPTNPTTICCTP
jgi:hypothetical protein